MRAYLIVLFCIFSIFSTAQTPFITGKIDLENKLDSLLEPFNNAQSPGCAVLVLQHGKVLAARNYGMASIEHEIPFTANNVVRMGYSEAREFLCIAAVLMEKDGLLDLNDRVQKYFPNLPKWSAQVTLWDLINHHSGFIDEWSALLLMHGSMADYVSQSQFLQLLYDQTVPEVEPGKGYMYSNSDYGLLKMILEKAGGEPLGTYIKRRILNPLGMISTQMHDNAAEVIPHFAMTYKPIGGGKYEQWHKDKSSPGGNYYMATTANDVQLWAAAMADSSSEIAKAVELLKSRGTLLPGKTGHYSFGQTISKINGSTVIRHEGVNGHVYLTRIPEKGMAIVTVGNFLEGFGFENDELLDYLLNVPKATAPTVFLTQAITVASKELEQYAGRYVWENQASWESNSGQRKTTDFYVENGVLMGDFGWQVFPLRPVGEGIFYWEDDYGVQLEFSQPTPSSPIQLLMRFSDGWPSNQLQKEAAERWTPSLEALQSFTGTYHSQHLDYFWTIKLSEAGKLTLHRPTMPDRTLEPDRDGEFILKIDKYPGMSYDAWVRFHLDRAGEISHLTVWHPRLMNHRFDKKNG